VDSSPLSTAAIIANSTTSSSSKNSVSFKAASSAVRTGMRSIRSRSDSTLIGRTMTSHSRGAEAAFEAFNRPGTLRLSGVSHTSGPRRSWSRAAIRIARRRIRRHGSQIPSDRANPARRVFGLRVQSPGVRHHRLIRFVRLFPCEPPAAGNPHDLASSGQPLQTVGGRRSCVARRFS
jgi:hypothetical protein